MHLTGSAEQRLATNERDIPNTIPPLPHHLHLTVLHHHNSQLAILPHFIGQQPNLLLGKRTATVPHESHKSRTL